MKKWPIFAVIFTLVLFAGTSGAQTQQDELSKEFPVVSVPYSVPDNDQQHFADVDFRFAWTNKAPFKIALQFVNRGYSTRKLKFAIKDVTSKKMVVLNPAHHSRFGTETLKANSTGAIWSGAVDNINDDFSLHVWDSDGEEFDKVAISIKDQQ